MFFSSATFASPFTIYASCSSPMIIVFDWWNFKKNLKLIRWKMTDLEILLVLLPLDLDFLFLCNLFLLHCMQHALRQWSYFLIGEISKKFEINRTKIDEFRHFSCFASSWSWFSFPLQPSHLLLQFINHAHHQWS